MIKESLKLDETIEFLNDLLKQDAEAVTNLCESRVKCNEEIANHPTVQVRGYEEKTSVGLLGILNGLFGVHGEEAGKFKGYGGIMAIYDNNNKIVKFARTNPKE